MAKEEKTNVMRVLTQKKVEYVGHTYEQDASLTGAEIAAKMGENPEAVFKTLVTQGKSKSYYVFVIPVEKELDLKKAAKAVGEKSIEMLPLKELLPLTGYVHGGCSPIGMKKFFTTTFDESLNKLDKVYFSGGKVGFQVEVAVEDIEKVIRYGTADITV
ncbi:MAG: Cys-tRNA(Pro) deacylase [Lachnospiraceae bacterium]|jgi:Cys-tRNA(Pro)/Cys-tRNA(Cys) deacylase|nr:Cys-tRNA(Pro) deacylase [Lachnospiraceae bacterium]